jgi:hypothetical protein
LSDYWSEVSLNAEGSVIGHIDRDFFGYFCLQEMLRWFPISKFLPHAFHADHPISIHLNYTQFQFISIKLPAMEATKLSSQIVQFTCNRLQGFGFLVSSVFHPSEIRRFPSHYVGL